MCCGEGRTTGSRQRTLEGMRMPKKNIFDYEPQTILPILHFLTMTQSPTFSMGWPVEWQKSTWGLYVHSSPPNLPSNFILPWTFIYINIFEIYFPILKDGSYINIIQIFEYGTKKRHKKYLDVFRGSCVEFLKATAANIPALRGAPPNLSCTFDACSCSTGPTKKLLTTNLGVMQGKHYFKLLNLVAPTSPPTTLVQSINGPMFYSRTSGSTPMLAPPGSKGANVNDLGNIFELKVFSFFGEWVIHLQIAHGGLETNGKRGERGNVQG